METSKHTVTIPMQDYVELTKVDNLKGITLLKDGPIYDAVKTYVQGMAYQQYSPNASPLIDMNKIELFIRIK